MGSLGAAAPKPVFAYFCLAAKVGRARGHEISLDKSLPETPRAGARNLPGKALPERNRGSGTPPLAPAVSKLFKHFLRIV